MQPYTLRQNFAYRRNPILLEFDSTSLYPEGTRILAPFPRKLRIAPNTAATTSGPMRSREHSVIFSEAKPSILGIRNEARICSQKGAEKDRKRPRNDEEMCRVQRDHIVN